MAKPHHARLWPTTLKPLSGFDFRAFLEIQAADLKKLVNGALDVAIEPRIVESVVMYSFTVIAPKLDYRYQLFSLRTIDDDFPARIVAPHMPEPFRVVPVADKKELEARLREIFHHDSTTRVIARLADEEQQQVSGGDVSSS
jgi:hypothetical protein